MKRGSSLRQGRWIDFVQEETKVRKNLGRLIHTVQHMPSTRYRKNPSSLWDLIGELESFQPPNSSRSMNCPQKSVKKPFSRKYLDLRLHPSRDASSSPECIMKNQKQDNKSQTIKCNSSKQYKKTTLKKTNADKNEEFNAKSSQDKRSFDKTKLCRNKNVKENELPDDDKDKKIGAKESQVNSMPRNLHLKPQSKQINFHIRRKPEETIVSKKGLSSQQFRKVKINQEPNLLENDKRYKDKVLDKLKVLKDVNSNKNKSKFCHQSDGHLDKGLSKASSLENYQASMVKQLTSYWNNLLNNEIDDNELSSSHESSDDPMINKSLQSLARSIYHNSRDKRRRISLSCHRSESSINILKKFDGLNDSSDPLKPFEEDKEQFLECLSEILSNGDKPKKTYQCLHTTEDLLSGKKFVPTNPYFLDMNYGKCCGDSEHLPVLNKSKGQEIVEPNFNLKAQHAIEVMEKLIRKLKRFCELPLTSDEINLSHSLRTMLCLMTATVLSSMEQVFDDCSEPELEVKTTSGECDNSTAHLSDVSLTGISNTDICNQHGRNDNLQLVAVQGITMSKVEDALRYLSLCKDYLWTEFLLNPRFDEEGLYNQDGNGNPPQSFTFVIEEEILFEDDSDDDESCFEEESEDEEEVESAMIEIFKSVFDSILISLERMAELAADMILHYWPNSFQGFVKTMYQTMVSLLVWWVIMKEIFCK